MTRQSWLAWLPIEEVVRNRQEDYYDSLGRADQAGDLTPFVNFMLTAIGSALEQATRQQTAPHPPGTEISSEMGSEIAAGTAAPCGNGTHGPLAGFSKALGHKAMDCDREGTSDRHPAITLHHTRLSANRWQFGPQVESSKRVSS